MQFGDKNSYYYDALAGEIVRLIDAASGHGLVLFTSYAAMSAVKERLRELDLRFPLFALDSSNPGHTVKRFKEQPGAVLLSTGAAWEGMDFPGDCVSLLVIPKLPFAFPDELREKQKEQYASLHDFIQAVVVPEMQIKLRQGFVLMQKTFTSDCISRKVIKNTGQLPMYLIQDHHEPIFDRDTFHAIQVELARRNAGKSPSKKNASTGKSCYASK